MLMWAMSDRTLPRSLRMMEGFGVHTFRLVNEAGKSPSCKFHWKPKLGMQSVVWDEAVKMHGADPDFHRRDLYDAIDTGDFPEWELGVQTLRRGVRRRVRLRRARRDQAHPRGGAARPDRRADGARPQSGQLLRRDRAGRLLHVEHRAGHRLLERSAAAGPALLLSRHAEVAAGDDQLPPAADQRAQVCPSPISSATATCRRSCSRSA